MSPEEAAKVVGQEVPANTAGYAPESAEEIKGYLSKVLGPGDRVMAGALEAAAAHSPRDAARQAAAEAIKRNLQEGNDARTGETPVAVQPDQTAVAQEDPEVAKAMASISEQIVEPPYIPPQQQQQQQSQPLGQIRHMGRSRRGERSETEDELRAVARMGKGGTVGESTAPSKAEAVQNRLQEMLAEEVPKGVDSAPLTVKGFENVESLARNMGSGGEVPKSGSPATDQGKEALKQEQPPATATHFGPTPEEVEAAAASGAPIAIESSAKAAVPDERFAAPRPPVMSESVSEAAPQQEDTRAAPTETKEERAVVPPAKQEKKPSKMAEAAAVGAVIAGEAARMAAEQVASGARKIAVEAKEKTKEAGAKVVEKAKEKGKEAGKRGMEVIQRGMGRLNEDARKFVRRLYLTGPAGAVNGVRWRMSFMVNDALARFYGNRASKYEADRKENTNALAGVQQRQRELQRELQEAFEAGGRAPLSKKISKSAEREQRYLAQQAVQHGSAAEAAGDSESVWEKGYKKYEARRDAAFAKLEQQANERLAVVSEKIEAAEKGLRTFDEAFVDLQHETEEAGIKIAQFQYKLVEIRNREVPTSQAVLMRWEENLAEAQQRYASAYAKLQGHIGSRQALKSALDGLERRKMAIAFGHESDKQRSEKQYTRLETEEAAETRPWRWEGAFTESEHTPPLRVTLFIAMWNEYFAKTNTEVNIGDFKTITETDDTEYPVHELENRLANYLEHRRARIKPKDLQSHLAFLRSVARVQRAIAEENE